MSLVPPRRAYGLLKETLPLSHQWHRRFTHHHRSFTTANSHPTERDNRERQNTVAKTAETSSQTQTPPKAGKTKIGIAIRSFDRVNLDSQYIGLPPSARKIRLPESRILYTVLRSPHIDKKSREQFQMGIKKQYVVLEAKRDELQKKFFWLKRQRIFGAQYEIKFEYKTRLDKGKLQEVLSRD
ncbi:ribosomal 40S subunit protein S10A [Ancistrocladus abbreviatus]